MKKAKLNDSSKITKLIIVSTLSTCILFIASFFLKSWAEVATKIISISYLVFFILFLLLRKKYPNTKIVTGKKERKKNFTGSTYRKIFHRKECRFADSIKDQYFIEEDKKEAFLKQGYKACKLCMSNKTNASDLKKKK